MGLDRLDIVLIHDCDVWTHGKEEAPGRFKEAMEGAYRALDKLRNEKVIKAIGFGINEADTCVKFAKAGDFDVAMMAGRYTLIDQTGLTEFLPLALEKNMGVMLAGVFNSGILATGSGAGRQVRLHGRSEGGRRQGEGDRGDLRASTRSRCARRRSNSRSAIPLSSRSCWAR